MESKHQGELAQGFNDPRLNLFGEERDQLSFRPLLQGFELAAKERREVGTVADKAAQVLVGDFDDANFT
jgi:hypothetical protein